MMHAANLQPLKAYGAKSYTAAKQNLALQRQRSPFSSSSLAPLSEEEDEAASVLEATDLQSDGESIAPASPLSPSSQPSLLETTMDEVSLAARRSTPLSPPTAALLARLFPSADSISVAAPSADGLGLSVAALLPRRQAAGCQQAQLLQHAEPLPGSGLLLFSLTAAPTHAECQLVHAFASELGARLLPRRNSTAPPPLPPALESSASSGMHDCFWLSC